jgi:hypothetical protein
VAAANSQDNQAFLVAKLASVIENHDPVVSHFQGTSQLIQPKTKHPGLNRVVGWNSVKVRQRWQEAGDHARTGMKAGGSNEANPEGVEDSWKGILVIG